MTLLNMDDAAASTPRVLPKVFADVPSTAELKAAEMAAAKAKSASSMLTIVTVLMAGALIAVAAFLVITLTNQSKTIQTAKDAAVADVSAAVAKQKEAEGKVSGLTTEISDLKLAYQPLKPVADIEKQVSDEIAAIKGKVDLPAFASARTSIKNPAGWAAYDDKFAWTSFDGKDWRTYVLTNQDRKLQQLKSLNADLAKFAGASGGEPAKKICPDNKPNC